MAHDALTIEGIDTESALKRLGNKRERYEALLQKFADNRPTQYLRYGPHSPPAIARPPSETSIRSRGPLDRSAPTCWRRQQPKAEQSLKAGLEDGVALQQLEVALEAVVQAIRSKLA